MSTREGNTPAKTPETTTKLAHFKLPQPDGKVPPDNTVHYGDESWPIVNGIVECPLEVGRGAEWPQASEPEAAAYQKAKAKAAKADDDKK